MSKTVVVTIEENIFNVRGAILSFTWIGPKDTGSPVNIISFCTNEDEEVIKKELKDLPKSPENVFILDSAKYYFAEISKYLPSTFTEKVEIISFSAPQLNGSAVLATLFVTVEKCKDNVNEAKVIFSWNEISGDSVSFCKIAFCTSDEELAIQKEIDQIPQILEKVFVLELQDFDLTQITKYLPSTFSGKIGIVSADVFEENKQNVQDEACSMILSKRF